jgi:3-phenylpropionate/trans-cinnamate dioxygenase ferredoxin subunit
MTTPLAAAHFRAVASSDAIANDAVVPSYLDDRRLRVAIARVDDSLYVFDDLCTCADERCPLSGGLLTGTTIMCQCHGTRFDITTGAPVSGPATRSLTVYEVRETDGAVEVRA